MRATQAPATFITDMKKQISPVSKNTKNTLEIYLTI